MLGVLYSQEWFYNFHKLTHPDVKENPLLVLCSAELAGATEASVLDG